MADIAKLLISAMRQHVVWDEVPSHAWQFSVDVDVDVTPYRVPVFWRDPPDTSMVYAWSDLIAAFTAGRNGDDGGTDTISAGGFRILFDTERYVPEPYNVYSANYEARRDDGAGGNMLVNAANYLSLLRNGKPRDVSLFDLLALIAANDARRDGRTEDEDALIGSIPFMAGARLLSLTDEQAAAVMQHVGETADDDGIPSLTKIRPHTYYWPNGKDSNRLTAPELFDDGGAQLNVGGQTVISFSLTPDEGIPASEARIDGSDRMIISAVSTLKESAKRETGEPVISAYNICETMGLMHPSTEAQAEVDRRMLRLMHITADIDYTNEIRRMPKGRRPKSPETGLPLDRFVITRHLVEVQRIEGVDDDGNGFIRYRLLADPPTHEHAKAIGQEVTWPQRLQELPATKSDGTPYRRSSTGRQIAIKHEILATVYSLKNPKSRLSNTIRYSTLCRTVGVDPKNRHAKKGVMDFAEGFLRTLHAEGVIRDFQTFTEGSAHARAGVRIFV